tara:strand:+ start:254 stop:415 length:162 start_codon:yes stop_codon:yes gene_type:complete
MNNKQNSRIGYTKLYNQKHEGIGSYDIHYINAYKKTKERENKAKQNTIKRQVA